MMAQYPDVFIMTFSIHIPNFVLLSQTAQLLLIFCYAAPLQRLTEIKETDDTEVYFGGLTLIAVGDFPLFVIDLCFKMAGDMCRHLHIYGGTCSQWWNCIPTCDKGMIPPTQRY